MKLLRAVLQPVLIGDVHLPSLIEERPGLCHGDCGTYANVVTICPSLEAWIENAAIVFPWWKPRTLGPEPSFAHPKGDDGAGRGPSR